MGYLDVSKTFRDYTKPRNYGVAAELTEILKRSMDEGFSFKRKSVGLKQIINHASQLSFKMIIK